MLVIQSVRSLVSQFNNQFVIVPTLSFGIVICQLISRLFGQLVSQPAIQLVGQLASRFNLVSALS